MTQPKRIRAGIAAGIAAITLVALSPAPVHAATFYVDQLNTSGFEDGDLDPNSPPNTAFSTINGAIGSALIRNGRINVAAAADPNIDPNMLLIDLIVVRPGIYRERVSIPSGITLRSQKFHDPQCISPTPCVPITSPAACGESIIDGNGTGPVVRLLFTNSQTGLDGFTVQGGATLFGGGITAQVGSPNILNNCVTGNLAGGFGTFPGKGGGMSIAADAIVEGNTIKNNTAIHGSGGGISISSGSPTITRNIITGNKALSTTDAYFGYGGGIAIETPAIFPSLTSNVITGNRADASGGGVDVYFTSPFITNNTFEGNAATGVAALAGNGGAINVVGTAGGEESITPTIANNLFLRNKAAGRGGALSIQRARPVVAANQFHDNRPDASSRNQSRLGLDGNAAGDPLLAGIGVLYPDPALPSPLVDTGTDGVLLQSRGPDGNLATRADNVHRRRALLPTKDINGVPRPLDSLRTGSAVYDIGAYEQISQPITMTGDEDGDQIPADSDMDPNTEMPCTGSATTGCDDNCPKAFNPLQEDGDGDLIGDACDSCSVVYNPATCSGASGVCSGGAVTECTNIGRPAECDLGFECVEKSCNALGVSADCADGTLCRQRDLDADRTGDICDLDIDNDGIPEDVDMDPNTTNSCRRGRTSGCDDNCPEAANATQSDIDKDGVGDLCDNCPRTKNPPQMDTDSDGLGDACDNCDTIKNGPCFVDLDFCDIDGDGILTTFEAVLGDQANRDSKKGGDACDSDVDDDGIKNTVPATDPNGFVACDGNLDPGCSDNCPRKKNPNQGDSDQDGIGNSCDKCKNVSNPGHCNGGGGQCSGGTVSLCTTIDAQAECDSGFTCVDRICSIIGARSECDDGFICFQIDLDGDGRGDECDADDDNDGVLEDDPIGMIPCTGGSSTDCDDNCPGIGNSAQTDDDGDGLGNSCDPDIDGDGIDQDNDPSQPLAAPCLGGATTGCDDNCPLIANPLQEDMDSDGVGDICDTCPMVMNSSQRDSDGDDIGDRCDVDFDNDNIPEDFDGNPAVTAPCTGGNAANCDDNCPFNANELQADDDGDLVGNSCDTCVNRYNPGTCIDATGTVTATTCSPILTESVCGTGGICMQLDADSDGRGDQCDIDVDGDGIREDGDKSGTEGDKLCGSGKIFNCDDNCPVSPNPTQRDLDKDGVGNVCDADVDGDGIPESFGMGSSGTCVGGAAATCDDNCARAPNPGQDDADSDGVGDSCDTCPNDAGASSSDADGDGRGDDCDNCPAVPNRKQKDSDNNGVGDACQGLSILLRTVTLGGDVILTPGGRFRLKILAENMTAVGERLDVRVALWDPSRKPRLPAGPTNCTRGNPPASGPTLLRTFTMDALPGKRTSRKTTLRIPGSGQPGLWVATIEACPRSGGSILNSNSAVTVK